MDAALARRHEEEAIEAGRRAGRSSGRCGPGAGLKKAQSKRLRSRAIGEPRSGRKISTTMHRRRPDRGRHRANQAIEIDPKDAAAYNNRCWLRATANRDLPLALADCDASVGLAPNDAGSLDSRGFLYCGSAASTRPSPITTRR